MWETASETVSSLCHCSGFSLSQLLGQILSPCHLLLSVLQSLELQPGLASAKVGATCHRLCHPDGPYALACYTLTSQDSPLWVQSLGQHHANPASLTTTHAYSAFHCCFWCQKTQPWCCGYWYFRLTKKSADLVKHFGICKERIRLY